MITDEKIHESFENTAKVIEEYIGQRYIYELNRSEALELCAKLNIKIETLPKSSRSTKNLRILLENEYTNSIIHRVAGEAAASRNN